MATRARARRERGAQPREKHASPIAAAQGSATPIAAQRHEAAIHHAGLTTADRWLLAALMLSSSVLIAVLTSALTVRGMQRTDAPVIAASAQPIVAARPAPSMAVRDTTVVGSPQIEESALVPAKEHADRTPARAEPSVGTSPSQTAQLSPRHVQASHTPKRSAPRGERRSVTIAEQMRTPPSILPPSASASSAPPIVPSATTAAPPTTSAPAAAAPAASNAQFLEELRAIRAEIDARKRHMDSLTAALDSLKHVSRPD